MVTHHQDKFSTAFGQGAALHATAGTAQPLKRILWRTLVRVFGPFLRSQAHRPIRFSFQFNIQQTRNFCSIVAVNAHCCQMEARKIFSGLSPKSGVKAVDKRLNKPLNPHPP